MSQADVVAPDPGAEEQLHPAEHAHPSERQYYVVALILAAVTALEVGAYYITGLGDDALIVLLAIFAVVKFVLVVLYFMHLKFDSPVFRRLFVAGIGLAIAVYVATLASMHFFSGGTKFVAPG